MAATAYASLVSLMNTIDHIMIIDNGRNLFSLNQKQLQSLQEKAAFLVGILECYSHEDNIKVEDLESQIADASHTAEDLIESKVVDYIQDNLSTSFDRTGSNPLYQQLQEVIEGMNLMKEEYMKLKESKEVKVQLPKYSIPSSFSSSLPAGKDTMVGFDDVLNQIMERLTLHRYDFQIIPISGMGGIGKTTLTRNVYNNPCIVEHFDIRAWVTISQEYQMKEILSSFLIEFKVLSKETTQGMDESQLGQFIHQHLFGRRYLIVMDDMWSIDVWDKVRLFFPDNDNGSGIMITTRLTTMSSGLGSLGLEVDFLDEYQSWNLLREKVFGQQECPLELEEIGKKIAKNCKGLPLSIVVMGGILAKSNMTQSEWVHVAKEVNSISSLAEDEQCSKILSLSYINLPVQLRPCFLYMGVFPEDDEIRVSRLIRLWVAEGLVKPNKYKSLEEVAEEYLIDLIDRNLIMVHKHGARGNVKICKIHDLLGSLCLREAEKERFLCVAKTLNRSQAFHYHRRIVIDGNVKEQKDCGSLLRSITFNTEFYPSFLGGKLIRVLNGTSVRPSENIVKMVNLRYIYTASYWFPSTIFLRWNIQTLLSPGVHVAETTAPPEIWEMKQLRHFHVANVMLPEPPPLIITQDGGQEDYTMKHLQTLKGIVNLAFSEKVVGRIPNIKKIRVSYDEPHCGKDYHCLSNLQHLHKLESLKINFECSELRLSSNFPENLRFPHSIKKLSLFGSRVPWEHMRMVGSLPNLQVLLLRLNAFIGEEWNSVEGQFLSLKHLEIWDCDHLKVWNAESIHFPVLERLKLFFVENLESIPIAIGEISTLRLIYVECCSDSVVSSAIDILDEQEDQGNPDIKVEVCKKNELEDFISFR